MRLLVLFVAFSLLSCSGGDRLIERCGQACYTGPIKTRGIGLCRDGILLCSSEGKICIDEVTPSQETCNGADDDCNGYVDDFAIDSSTWYRDRDGDGFGSENEPRLSCRIPQGYSSTQDDCDDSDPSVHPQAQEVCNGIDDNCDGRIDEHDSEEFCYDGDPRQLSFPGTACHAGVKICVGGNLKCVNEVLPKAEICDGVDNDCDGQIDEDFVSPDNFDIIFLLDESGSMYDLGKFANSIQAIQSLSGRYVSQSFAYALIDVPRREGEPFHIVVDLSDSLTFLQAILNERVQFSSLELFVDVIQDVCDPTNPLNLSWREGSRKFIFFFTDEEPQSLRNLVPSVPVAECSSQGTVVFGFVESETGWEGTFTNLGSILSPSTSMELQMEETIGEICPTSP